MFNHNIALLFFLHCLHLKKILIVIKLNNVLSLAQTKADSGQQVLNLSVCLSMIANLNLNQAPNIQMPKANSFNFFIKNILSVTNATPLRQLLKKINKIWKFKEKCCCIKNYETTLYYNLIQMVCKWRNPVNTGKTKKSCRVIGNSKSSSGWTL